MASGNQNQSMTELNSTRVAALPADSSCQVCESPITKMAIKCTDCNNIFHSHCTNLPMYVCVAYFTTRKQYNCEQCVKSKTTNYDSIEKMIGEFPTSHKAVSIQNDVLTALNKLTVKVDQLTLTPHQPEVMTAVNKLTNKVEQLKQIPGQQPRSYSAAVIGNVKPTHDVIIKSDQGTANMRQTVTKALNKVPIVNMTNTRAGHVVVKLPDENAAQKAIASINSSQLCAAEHLPKISPKLTITNVEKEMTDDEILSSIINKNTAVSDLLHCDEDFRILFSKNTGEYSQTVIVKTTSAIRAKIFETNTLYVGTRRCRVYDRFWVSRCANCQSYSHRTTNCRMKSVCGCCAEQHKTNDCTKREQHKCHNCITAGRRDIHHAAFSVECPIFANIRWQIMKRTDIDSHTKN